ncbi:Hypothetical predicted protein [Pelobates cultripes]|uniref:Mid2 domain-containing protein n=1 Tax=Pelobates cultripes TaxID=61616 RepID=A0AAD1T9F0_PELCU|nr:Hypothetical predicted protein [Pelobates cultripes]
MTTEIYTENPSTTGSHTEFQTSDYESHISQNSTESYYSTIQNFTISLSTTSNITTSGAIGSKDNALVIGLSVGIPCACLLLLAIGLTLFCLHRKKQSPKDKINLERSVSNPYATTIKAPSLNSEIYDDVGVRIPEETYEGVMPNDEEIYQTTIS